MSYIGNSPGVASQRVLSSFTATSGQTVFTPSAGYTLGYLDVYQNGVKLIVGDDYTASDGVTFTLTTGAATGDAVECVAYFPRGLSDGYLKAEADAKYVDLTNAQTVAGVKTFSSNPILSAGTANSVIYLNSSKAQTSSSALTWDGSLLSTTVADNTVGVKFKAATSNIRFLPQDGGAAKIAALNAAESAFYPLITQGSSLQYVIDTSEVARFTSSSFYTASGINVGIGTSSNLGSSKLDVRGRIRLGSGTSAGDSELIFSNYASATTGWITAIRQDVGGANNDLKFLRFNSSGTFLDIPMQISSTDGYVGIGTDSPNAKLGIRGDMGTSVSAVMRIRGTNATARTTRLQFEDYSGGIVDGFIDLKIVTAGSAASALLQLGVNGPGLTIDYNNYVGIGTTSMTMPFRVASAQSGNWMAAFDNSGTNPYGVRIDTSTNSGSAFSFAVYTNSGTGMYVLNTGMVGFGGTNNPSYPISVSQGVPVSSGGNARIKIGNHIIKGTANDDLFIYGYNGETTGGLLYVGAYYTFSARSIKSNIVKLENSLNKICQLNGYSYTITETGRNDIGLIADEVETVFPDLIAYDENNKANSIDYTSLTAALIESIKEQQAIIESLKTRITALENN